MSEAITQAAAYDLIDRFLRNNLYDDDYAKYSEALEAISQPAPSPQPAVPVVSGWSIDDHRDGSVTIETPEGRIISLHRSGGSGMESTAYSLAILSLRPAVEPMTDEQIVQGQEQQGAQSILSFMKGVRFAEAHHGITAKAEDTHQPTKEAGKP